MKNEICLSDSTKKNNTVSYINSMQAYEEPDSPELALKTVDRTIQETVLEVIELLEQNVSLPQKQKK